MSLRSHPLPRYRAYTRDARYARRYSPPRALSLSPSSSMRRLLAFYGRAVSRGSSTRGFLGREFSTASKSLHPASTIAHVYAASQSEILDESSMGDDCVICRSKRNETKGKPACRFLLPLWFLGISFAVTTERIRISGRMRQRIQCLQIDATPENLVEFHFMRPQKFTLTLEGPQKSNADIVKNIASKKKYHSRLFGV